MEGDKARDSKKEFFFDHSYWSVDPKDQHFITQEQVRIVLNYRYRFRTIKLMENLLCQCSVKIMNSVISVIIEEAVWLSGVTGTGLETW